MDQTIINQIKSLAIDMIEVTGTEEHKACLSEAPIIYSLYANHLNVNPLDANWLNRDRLITSCGYGSALLYATLFYAGYNITLDDIKQYRKLGSLLPGYSEYGLTSGVDASTGLFGQNIATTVGIALGERYLHEYFKNFYQLNYIDYYTYVLASDGDLMEGISYEASSFAGYQKLNKLIIIYNSKKNLEENTFNEDISMRYKSMGFYTQIVLDGNCLEDINKAVRNAKNNKVSPSFIEIRTAISDKTKKDLNISLVLFMIDDDRKEYLINKIRHRFQIKYLDWLELKKKMFNFDDILNHKVNFNNYQFINKELYLCQINDKVINYVIDQNPLFIGGCTDTVSSCMMHINNSNFISNKYPLGKNICYGIRENAMGSITNGLSLSGLIPFCSTSLAFSDCLKPSIRTSALSNLNVLYIFTHDSITIGSDGPTHQPIEQLNSLRCIPNMVVLKPYDEYELVGCYKYILNSNGPKSLILSNQVNTSKINGIQDISSGAYIISKETGPLDGIIIASGYEVGIALNVQAILLNSNINIRVVSMPSIELYLKSSSSYQSDILPPMVKKFVIEMGESSVWYRFVYHENYLFNINTFGRSGTTSELIKYFKFDPTYISNRIIELLDK